jgi:hypothetical protein
LYGVREMADVSNHFHIFGAGLQNIQYKRWIVHSESIYIFHTQISLCVLFTLMQVFITTLSCSSVQFYVYIYIYSSNTNILFPSLSFLPSSFISFLPSFSRFAFSTLFLTSWLPCLLIVYLVFYSLLPLFLYFLPSFPPSFPSSLQYTYIDCVRCHTPDKNTSCHKFVRWMQHYRKARIPAKHWNQQTRHC